jgi:hypothetical protein
MTETGAAVVFVADVKDGDPSAGATGFPQCGHFVAANGIDTEQLGHRRIPSGVDCGVALANGIGGFSVKAVSSRISPLRIGVMILAQVRILDIVVGVSGPTVSTTRVKPSFQDRRLKPALRAVDITFNPSASQLADQARRGEEERIGPLMRDKAPGTKKNPPRRGSGPGARSARTKQRRVTDPRIDRILKDRLGKVGMSAFADGRACLGVWFETQQPRWRRPRGEAIRTLKSELTTRISPVPAPKATSPLTSALRRDVQVGNVEREGGRRSGCADGQVC